MSGDTPFARGPLANDIGVEGQEDQVEDMLKGTYVMDETGMDAVHASSEMKCICRHCMCLSQKELRILFH